MAVMPKDGAIDYFELPCSDAAATKKFYADVFAWKLTDYGPEYVAFEFDGREGGFNTARKVVSGGGALLVLYANDLDAMERKIRDAGAEILSHHDFPGGRRFHFRDPSGNEIAVWTKR
jgi:predicted enzyme related to lactoylglutathione lyase